MRFLKRVLDAAAAALLLVVLALPMGAVAAVIRSRLGCPVLFRQVRAGRHGRPFALYKFRTLTNDRGADGRLLSDEERLTSLGAGLRRLSLDELPQLWNVLRGDMSFVGPRPLYMEYVPWYTEREMLRLTVRPGITGLAQVEGRNLLPWDARLEMDVRYVEGWTPWLDWKILFRTVGKVLGGSGVVIVPGRMQKRLDDQRRELAEQGRQPQGDVPRADR